MTHIKKTIFGIWNIDISPLTLGGLITFIVELQIQLRIYGTPNFDICFIGSNFKSCRSIEIHNMHVADPDAGGISAPYGIEQLSVITILRDFSPVSCCHFFRTFEEFQEIYGSDPSSRIVWPDVRGSTDIPHKYNDTRYIQNYFRQNGFIPLISSRGESEKWATEFIKNIVSPSIPVVIHLKNNQNQKNCSNANFDAWYGFFLHYIQKSTVKFILIGNEPLDSRIISLPNVIITADNGGNLPRDLALVSKAAIFMGMSSGPCNIAIYSDIPYAIYKNPDHDVEEMKLELGNSSRFTFSTNYQQLLRVFESTERLIEEFEELSLVITKTDME